MVGSSNRKQAIGNRKNFRWNTRTRMKVFIVASIFAGYLMWYVVTQYPRLQYQADIAGIVWAIGGVWFGSFAAVVLGIAGEKIWGKPENVNPYMCQDVYAPGGAYRNTPNEREGME